MKFAACFLVILTTVSQIQFTISRPAPDDDVIRFNGLMQALKVKLGQITAGAKAGNAFEVYSQAATSIGLAQQLVPTLFALGVDAQGVASSFNSRELSQAVGSASSKSQALSIYLIFFINEIYYNAGNFPLVFKAAAQLDKLMGLLQTQASPVKATASVNNSPTTQNPNLSLTTNPNFNPNSIDPNSVTPTPSTPVTPDPNNPNTTPNPDGDPNTPAPDAGDPNLPLTIDVTPAQ